MEAVQQKRLIAVDTSFGTNFLISACDHETVSELRGFIRNGHLSCFPEYGSINVVALTVEYSGRQYHVTDSLNIGQVCRKSWNKIHADVSSGILTAPSNSKSPHSSEAERLANKRTWNQCAFLGDKLLPKSDVTKGLGLEKRSNEDLVQGPLPLFCGEKVASFCKETTPMVLTYQTSSKKPKKRSSTLLSADEHLYTQSHSEVHLIAEAGLQNGYLVTECKRKRRKQGRKSKHYENTGQNNLVSHKNDDLSPSKKRAVSVEGDVEPPEHKSSSLRDQQLKQDTLCQTHLNGQIVNIGKGSQDDVDAREKHEKKGFQSEYIPSTNICVADERIQKEDGMEEPSLRVDDTSGNKVSLEACLEQHTDPRGLLGSLSADFVLGTQESEFSCQVEGVAELEKVVSPKGNPDAVNYMAMRFHSNSLRQDPLEFQAVHARELSCHEDMINKTLVEMSNLSKSLAFPSKEKEVPNLKHCVAMHPQPSENDNAGNDIEIVQPWHADCDDQFRTTRPTCDKHDKIITRKKKKHKRRKFLDSPKVSGHEDCRHVVSGSKTVHLLKSSAVKCNDEKRTDNSPLVEGQLLTRPKDLGANYLKMTKRSASVVPPSPKISGEKTAVPSGTLEELCSDEKFGGIFPMLEEEQTHPQGVCSSSKEKTNASVPKAGESEHDESCRTGMETFQEGSNRMGKIDLSACYFVEVNDHSASLSADVVPDTQDSKLQGQNDENLSQEMVPPKTGKNNAGNDAERLNPHNVEGDHLLHETGIAAGSNSSFVASKRKRHRKRKSSDIPRVSVQEEARLAFSGNSNRDIEAAIETAEGAERIFRQLEESRETYNHRKGAGSCHMLEDRTQTEPGEMNGSRWRQDGSVWNADEGKNNGFSLAGDEAALHAKVLMELGSANANGRNGIEDMLKGRCKMQDVPYVKDGAVSHGLRRIKKKQRKDRSSPRSECLLVGDTSLNVTNEGKTVPFFIKELPDVLRLNASRDIDVCQEKKAQLISGQVSKKNPEKQIIEEEPNIDLMQGLDQETATTNTDVKDGCAPSLLRNSSPEGCSEDGIVTTKPSFNVFDYEGSATTDCLYENSSDLEVAGTPEASNLDKISSAAVELVENHILNSSGTTTRKSNRKSIHPKRWIEVLSERLNLRRTARNSSKKQRAIKRHKPIPEEEIEAKAESSQNIIFEKAVVCRAGCGRLYGKKTSAYYRHCRMCKGK